MWDEVASAITVPVSCCVDDVFEGQWLWMKPVESHYTRDNVDPRSGALFSSQDLVDVSMQGRGPMFLTPALARQGSGTGLALGDDGANATSDVVPGERMALRVRFNPEVEIHEYEPDSNFNFMEVDDVIPPTEPLVVDGPVQHHFSTETEGVIPINSDAGVEDDQPEFELDVDDDAYVVLHGFGVLQASTATLSISPEEPLKVITYGIRGVSLGRRDTWVTVAELPHLKRVLWDLWQDAVPQHAACWAFAVRPQPLLELQVARAWILLVEIDPGEATPPGYCATLTLTCNEEREMFARPLPRLVREDTTTEALILQLSHSQVCLPDGLRPCRLEVSLCFGLAGWCSHGEWL